MAVLPMLIGNLLEDITPSRLLEKHFGSDVFPADVLFAIDDIPRQHRRKRSWKLCNLDDKENQVALKKTKDGFHLDLNLQEFKPEEISVTTDDQFFTVEAKQEEKENENGYSFRHLIKKFRIPEGHDTNKMVSSLSPDGMLRVKAPRIASSESKTERIIPITRAETKSKETETKKDSEKKKT